MAMAMSGNIPPQPLAVDKAARAALKGQRPCVVWLTGLSGSGKSTIANLVEQGLLAAGRHSYLLDGDNLRRGLNQDLGFSIPHRVENIRRVTETAGLMVDAGLVVITSLISPLRAERDAARARFEPGEFIEVFVDAPLKICEQRDPKGLYRRARRGEIRDFTGLDSLYEPPLNPELTLPTAKISPEEAAARVLEYLGKR